MFEGIFSQSFSIFASLSAFAGSDVVSGQFFVEFLDSNEKASTGVGLMTNVSSVN